jgi:glycogen(starch) synthase
VTLVMSGEAVRFLTIGLLYPPYYLGGYELVCQGVVHAARARGHDVQVLVSDYHAPGVREPEEPGVDRGLRSYLDATAQLPAALGPRECVGLERHNGAVLERHLLEFVPDVVSWWGMGGMSLALIERVRRAGLPSVLAVHDPWLSYGPEADIWTRRARKLQSLAPVLEPLLGIPVRYRLRDAGRFLFNSQHMLDESLAAGFAPNDRAVLTPGAHPRYKPSPRPERWGGRLLYVGRLDPVKGVDVLLAAVAELPDVTLRLVGSGNELYESELRRQAQSLGVQERVEFAGAVDAELLPSIYADADAVIFPVRWQEPWGLVPLEAMAVGRPVIATSRGGAATYLRDGDNALLMPVDDPQALAALVRRLAESQDLRAKLREGGLKTAAEHSAGRYEQLMVDELERAGNKAVSR